MKKLGLLLLILGMLSSFVACSKDKDVNKTQKTTSKKANKDTLETVLPLKYPSGTNPEKYGQKIMAKGTAAESAEDLSKKYDILVKKEFSLLSKFGVNLQDVSVCCSVETVTGCYLNYLTGKKWTNAVEFKKEWTLAMKNLPKNFYDLMNNPDIPFDTKLKTVNKYGYLAYPFVEDLYNYNFYSPANVCLVGKYHMTYELTDKESELLQAYYNAYELTEEDKISIKNYLSNYMKFNEQSFEVN